MFFHLYYGRTIFFNETPNVHREYAAPIGLARPVYYRNEECVQGKGWKRILEGLVRADCNTRARGRQGESLEVIETNEPVRHLINLTAKLATHNVKVEYE